jgi:anaerobic selenocysteine-containing dehydrogenase
MLSMSETHPSICRLCMAFCPVLVEVEGGKAVHVSGDPHNDLFQGYTCPKGRALPEQHVSPNRLLHSLKRDRDGVRQPIASVQAMDEVAERVSEIIAKHGPNSVAIYVGTGSLAYPASVPVALAWLQGIGSSMFYTPATIDQPGKVISMALHGGWRAGEQTFEDSDTWLIAGANPVISKCNGVPGQNPGRKLKDAVRGGMKLVVIDPRRTETARRATVHLQARPGEDPAILAGLIRVILEEKLYDGAFVEENAEGMMRLAEAVRDFTPEYVSRRAGVPAEDLVRAARIFGGGRRGSAVAGTGPNMATRGTLTEYLILCLNTLCGRWARVGDKVQRPNVMLPAYTARAQPFPPYPPFGGQKMRVRGYADAVCGLPTAALADEILLEGEGQIRALFCLGGNPMMAWPDQRRTHAALKDLDLLVTIDPELSATAELAHYVIAPQLTFETPGMSQATEAMKYYSYGGLGFCRPWGQYSPRLVEPPESSDVIEDWQFFYGLAQRMNVVDLKLMNFFSAGQHVESPPLIFPIDAVNPPTTEEIYAQLVRDARIPLSEVQRHPNGRVFDEIDDRVQPREDGNTDRLQLADPSMMEMLAQIRAEDYAGRQDEAYPFLLVPRRANNFVNSIGRSIDRLTGERPYNPAYLHPDDLAALGLADGQGVEIRSTHDAIWAVVQTDETMRRGVVAMTHAFGGQPDEDHRYRELGSNTGRLMAADLDHDPISGIPRMGALPIAISPLTVGA